MDKVEGQHTLEIFCISMKPEDLFAHVAYVDVCLRCASLASAYVGRHRRLVGMQLKLVGEGP